MLEGLEYNVADFSLSDFHCLLTWVRTQSWKENHVQANSDCARWLKLVEDQLIFLYYSEEMIQHLPHTK